VNGKGEISKCRIIRTRTIIRTETIRTTTRITTRTTTRTTTTKTKTIRTTKTDVSSDLSDLRAAHSAALLLAYLLDKKNEI
jgi:hypothetical protein